MKYITKTYDLILIGLFFTFFLFSFISDSYEYFFHLRFFEGFMVVGMTIIFTLFSLPFLILLFFRKDNKSLKVIGLIVLAVFIIGFLGFAIPLAILPLILGFGLFYIFKESKNRIINERKNGDTSGY